MRASRIRFAWTVVAGLLLVLLAPSVQAGERMLTEADLKKLIPLLEAEIASLALPARDEKTRQSEHKARGDADDKLLAEMAGGKIDPLAWLRSKSRDAKTPQEARYLAACSRASSRRPSSPAAVFTLGMEAPKVVQDYLEEASRSSSLIAHLPDSVAYIPGGEKIGAAADRLRSFYLQAGFAEVTVPGLFASGYRSPDGLVNVWLQEVNRFASDQEGCKGTPSGPLLVLSASDALFNNSHVPLPAKNLPLEEELNRQGMSAGDYEQLKIRLFDARLSAQHDDMLQKLDEMKDQAAAEGGGSDAEFMASIEGLKAEIVAYRKNEAVLAPLLERYFIAKIDR